MTLTPSASNILAVYYAASADDLRDGLSWYQRAHNWCRVMAGSNRPHLIRRNAGIVAALSPMNKWDNNKRKAALLISRRGGPIAVKGKSNGIGLSENVNKARAIYNGADPLDVLGGDKVRAFYSTILDPQGDVIPVIDRHAFDIAVGERTNDAARSILSRAGMYDRFADAYREAAKIAGIGSAQMQAITWIAWRRIHNIKDDD